MPDDKTKVPEVNLLPGDDYEGKPGGQFLYWALTWGKRIVVTTELIVILAFLSRFWLDTEVANNTDKINQEKTIIQSASDFEQQFRLLSNRITKANALEKKVSPLTVYDQIQKLVPLSVSVTEMKLTDHSVSITANSDEVSLAQLVNSFKNSPLFAEVAVSQVSRTSSGQNVSYSMQANYLSQKATR